jgi:putative PIN family toxin of toxin-antitoxin system
MTGNRSVKVILDTNVWISFLIGKKLLFLKELIVNERIKIVLCAELIEEIESVAYRPHLKKYSTDKLVEELKILLDIVAETHLITPEHDACRDPKDNFLLDLIDEIGRAHV